MKNLISILFFLSGPLLSMAQDSLTEKYKPIIISELKMRNESLIKSDLKLIYKYVYKSDLDGLNFGEFEKKNQITLNAMKNDSIQIDSFLVGEPRKVIKCRSEYQCVINQETFMSMPENNFSFKSIIIAISEDTVHWSFINAGTNEPKDIIRLYSNLCEELFD